MKKLLLLIPLLLLVGCAQNHPIDSLFPWPSSGVPEADSLLLKYERIRTWPSIYPEVNSRSVADRFSAVASKHPENKVLQIRSAYLQACHMTYRQDKTELQSFVDSILQLPEIQDMPYDRHMIYSLLAEFDSDMLVRYQRAVENIDYFQRQKADIELNRNLNLLGITIMRSMNDTAKALENFYKALEIADKHNLLVTKTVHKINIAILSSKPVRDSINRSLLRDPDVIQSPRVHAIVLQNAFSALDSLPLIEKAIDLYNRSEDLERANLPMVLGLAGYYYAAHGQTRKGINYLRAGLDSIHDEKTGRSIAYDIHNMLADAYEIAGEADSCAMELFIARDIRKQLDQDIDTSSIFAQDLKWRIEMNERNARLEREQIMAIFIASFLVLGLAAAILVSRYKARAMRKQFETTLLEEKLENNRQSVRAQAMVIQEGDNLIAELEERITTMKGNHSLSEESADALMRCLRIFKGNNENRKGYLKINKEIHSSFVEHLKSDYPSLTENMLKLSSLIAAGVDSRQIGAIMNIEPSSVHKSRYRLRTRLGLTPEQSLEDFLRKYNKAFSDSDRE